MEQDIDGALPFGKDSYHVPWHIKDARHLPVRTEGKRIEWGDHLIGFREDESDHDFPRTTGSFVGGDTNLSKRANVHGAQLHVLPRGNHGPAGGGPESQVVLLSKARRRDKKQGAYDDKTITGPLASRDVGNLTVTMSVLLFIRRSCL